MSKSTTTASINGYRLNLDFAASDVSPGEAITYLDSNTTINIAAASDGNGNWTGSITSAHPGPNLRDIPLAIGDTISVCEIGDVVYSVQISNQPGERSFEAIQCTITGVKST